MEKEDPRFEEYKILIEERHQLMSRYAQALALYLALMGFVFNKLMMSNLISGTFFLFMTFVNGLAFYGAYHFKLMAMKAEKRALELARELKIFEPQSLIWGYYIGVTIFAANELYVICLLIYNWIK